VIVGAGAARRRVSMPFLSVALHESGHVMGFGHFYEKYPSIMVMAPSVGAAPFTDLEEADRLAVRRLYDLATAASSHGGAR